MFHDRKKWPYPTTMTGEKCDCDQCNEARTFRAWAHRHVWDVVLLTVMIGVVIYVL